MYENQTLQMIDCQSRSLSWQWKLVDTVLGLRVTSCDSDARSGRLLPKPGKSAEHLF